MIERVDVDSLGEVTSIVSGGTADVSIHADMTYDDLSGLHREELCFLMVFTGYLNAVPAEDGLFFVSIPNREVRNLGRNYKGGLRCYLFFTG